MIRTRPVRLVARLVLVPSWIVAVALLVKGHGETGDGFSAGLLAATGLVVHFVAVGAETTRRMFVVRHAFAIAGVGLLLVLAPVMLPLLAGEPPLTHYPAPGSAALRFGALELHSGFVLDLGIAAVVIGFVTRTVALLAAATVELRRTAR